ncbi:MAG: M3 family metallopeptidase, partial [Balneolaceae bacterium]
MNNNPFFAQSTLPFEAPDFSIIRDEHYMPAFVEGMRIQKNEMEAIANNPDAPTFENTIVAMEKSGDMLTRVQRVFFNMTSAHTNEKIQEIQAEVAPRLASHNDDIYLNAALFSRVEELYNNRDELALDSESQKLLYDTHRDFIRAGANLSEQGQQRVREINERMSSLTTEFQEKLLEMTRERAVLIENEDDLGGLSTDRISAAKEAAEERGHEGKYLISITNTTRQPVLSSLHKRNVREKVWKASAYRGVGENDGINTQPLLKEMVELRRERAQLLGYTNYASYALDPQTAQNPENVLDMLRGGLIDPLNRNVDQETESIREMMRKEGIEDHVQPWDWEYYADKVRSERYDLDENEVRSYFELDRVLKDGVFYTMNRLFGIRFEERFDLPVYHPDVRVFDVFEEDGSQIGLFYGDFFARDSKRGGAWMSSYVNQSHLLNKKPVIVNVLNIPKPADGEPALISFSNTTTLFHEMGHA